MDASVERIFITPTGGADMQSVAEVEAMAGCGLSGDRYCKRAGFWSGVDECEVTLIEGEDLDAIKQTTGIRIENGEHRRNLVTRNIRLEDLVGKQFKVGEAVLEFDRPRPPCGYIQSITEPGMTRALLGRSGICARVIQSGKIHVEDPIVILPAP